MDGCARKPLREQEHGFFGEYLREHARLYVLLRNANVHIEVERAQRRRLRARGGDEARDEDGDEVRGDGDVGLRVLGEVEQRADDLEMEGVRTAVWNQPDCMQKTN